ncbi:hypothetical protein AKJ16_DCAP11661 [Drosera capensis]
MTKLLIKDKHEICRLVAGGARSEPHKVRSFTGAGIRVHHRSKTSSQKKQAMQKRRESYGK